MYFASSLFTAQTSNAYLAFMDVNNLWEGRVPYYIDGILAIGHRYKHIIAGRLALSIGVETLGVLLLGRAIATEGQL